MKILISRLSPLRARVYRLSRVRIQKRAFVHALGKSLVKVAGEIEDAIQRFKPVVALETTIYTHGWPCPDNIQLALNLQDLVRHHGAIPATIGVINGVATIGLTDREIINLCLAAGKPETMKVTRRELPYILGMGLCGRHINGGTTVSGTMFLANWAGIHIVGTGGIGGVHRGGQDSLDISADLTELGRTPIAVVSSGCKSFLDIPRTLEYLETQGALVATFADGRDGDIEFPAFYSRNSGVTSPLVVQDARQAAAIIFAKARMGRKRNRYTRPGTLIANPIPEEFSISQSDIEKAINSAVTDAAEKGIHGHANTPFILARIKDLTKGRSLSANRALIESNVTMAAKIATHLSCLQIKQNLLHEPEPLLLPKIRTNSKIISQDPTQKTFNYKNGNIIKYIVHDKSTPEKGQATDTLVPKQIGQTAKTSPPTIAILGAVATDLSCNLVLGPKEAFDTSLQPTMKTSNIARIEPSLGGVGHNVALAAQLVDWSQCVRLCSLVANDLSGRMIIDALKSENLDISGIKVLPTVIQKSGIAVSIRTAQYVAINDGKKDLVLGMGDMEIFRQSPYLLTDLPITGLKWVVIDANWRPYYVRWFMRTLRKLIPDVKIAFEPVSQMKGADIFRTSVDQSQDDEQLPNALNVFPNHHIDLATPNVGELNEIFCAATSNGYFENNDHWNVLDAFGIMGTQSRDRYRQIAGEELTDLGVPYQSIQLLPYMPRILTKLGPKGVLLTELLRIDDPRLKDPEHARWIISRSSNSHMYIGGVYLRLFPAAESVDSSDIVSVNGVGDTFLGVLVSGLSKNINLDEKLIHIAQKGAVMTLKCKQAVSPDLGKLQPELDKLVKTFVPKTHQHPPEKINHSASVEDFGVHLNHLDKADHSKIGNELETTYNLSSKKSPPSESGFDAENEENKLLAGKYGLPPVGKVSSPYSDV